MKFTERQSIYYLSEDIQVTLHNYYPTVVNKEIMLSGRSLTIYRGYPWNGSDVVNDRDCGMKASLVHDVLCSLQHKGLLSNREEIDQEYNLLTESGGMSWLPRKARQFGLWMNRFLSS